MLKKVKLCSVVLLIAGMITSAFAQVGSKKAPVDLNLEKEPVHFRQAFSQKATLGVSLEEYQQRQHEMFQMLISEQPALSEKSLIKVALTQEDRVNMEDSSCENCAKSLKLKVGVSKILGMGIDFTNISSIGRFKAPRAQSNGMMHAMPDGGYVWTTAVEGVDATALRMRFTDFNLPENTSLYLYNESGQAFGPYTGKGPSGTGEFWSNTVFGSVAFVQLRHTGPVNIDDLRKTVFVIQEVGYVGHNFLPPLFQGYDNIRHKSFCNFNEPCVQCATPSQQDDSIALIFFSSGGGLYICSGGLLADTDNSTEIPYFLTANHCINKGSEASSVEAYFLFTTDCNNANCFDPRGVLVPTLGASILSNSSNTDHSFMQLSQSPPAGSTYLGWTSAPVANSNGTGLSRVSHPAGAPQAYSEHNVDTSKGTCGGLPRGNFIYSHDTYGATEGGSSGSPVVLRSTGQVVGQLYGACGFNVNDPCDTNSNATVDGALAAYFSSVSQYLDPVGGPGGGFTLTTVGFKQKGKHKADLSWTGSSASSFDIYRDGALIATVSGNSYRDNIDNKGKGSYTHQVCEAGSSTCSNTTSISF